MTAIPPRRYAPVAPEKANTQTPQQIAESIESFLAEYPAAVLLEDGKLLFDMREAKYSLASEHNRCILHLWSEERNLVRRIGATTLRSGHAPALSTHRFGQTRPQTLELRRQPRPPHTIDA